MKKKFDRFGALLFALASTAIHGDCDGDLRSALAREDTGREPDAGLGERPARPAAGGPAAPAGPEGTRTGPVPDDDRGELRRANTTVAVRAIRKDAREADFVASTEDVDSHGSIIRQDWDFARFAKNPVILWHHGRDWAVPNLPIGRAVKWAVEKGQLVITVRFASAKANPFAELVWQSILEDMLRAGSVGFWPGKIAQEKIGEGWVDVLSACELVEFSICPIGSNENALVQLGERVMRGLAGEAMRGFGGGERRPAAETGNNRGPRTRAEEKRNVKKKFALGRAHLDEVRAKGFTTVLDGEGDDADVVLIECPDGRALLAEADAQKARADAAERQVAEISARVGADKAALELKITTAEKDAKDANARAASAIEARVKLELDPLVEGGAIEPSERDAMASLASAGKDTEYASLRAAAEKRLGGEKRSDGGSATTDLLNRAPLGTPPKRAAGDAGNASTGLAAGRSLSRLLADA